MVKALVLYHSQEYGNTAKMARAVAEGLEEAGCKVDVFNTNDGRYDVTLLTGYDCVAFGTPDYYSYVAGGLKTFMDDHYIHRVRKGLKGLDGKLYSLFYSHGGGGRVKESLGLFKYVGTLVGETVGSYGSPDDRTLERCRALGKELAKAASVPS
ncbi:MAG: flavodoxin domain-containing protein [Candidatus Bathyarchaeota archaeon]|jgi:NAD(P)H dehydrogenase (quinone)